ncbi:MAG: Glycosyl hydrolase, family 57 [Candidatus Woesebacteria bacterium GW2011_GWA1_39_21]|uniref:Glycosyl hydrolase, family 57 n=1 Tax=Candidatus Woesebacteria bacterium GW2011_GWA1_39_21 TaxID=1618550 RepID=A0A0G0N2H7_9BACT|nr:MAG: Glycosyl hydrolase, family 57 [Candidatus Woesebacteria bacterium GW2011_GWA1_39_21]
MPSICLYFQVHQPLRVKKYRIFDIGKDHNYFNDQSFSNLNNKNILEKVANKAYLPANELLLSMLKKNKDFKISFSFSGIFLEQLKEFNPRLLKSFRDLVKTGKVEILSETYYHSLSFFYSLAEFESQVELHRKIIWDLFGKKPAVFRNTELAYNNDLAYWANQNGYKAILAEGWDTVLGWRSPNFVYEPNIGQVKNGKKKIKLLLKNYKLSDDIAFRFSEKRWKEWPLTAEKFASWINQINGSGEVVNLFMDYETFGEHQWKEHGIFDFLKALPDKLLENKDNNFVTPSETVEKYPARDIVDVPYIVTWADSERDLSAWTGNNIQKSALKNIYLLEKRVKEVNNKKILEDWRRLQTSDHFYYMCTKWFSDGDVHKYFNPYESPYDAFISYMNVLNDFKIRLTELNKRKPGVVRKSIN